MDKSVFIHDHVINYLKHLEVKLKVSRPEIEVIITLQERVCALNYGK